jgi:hypothetical protein
VQHLCLTTGLYMTLGALGKAPHAAFLRNLCSTAESDLLIHVMEQALPGGAVHTSCSQAAVPFQFVPFQGKSTCKIDLHGGSAGGRDVLMAIQGSIEQAIAAREALLEPGAEPLDPEIEQRLQALLVERVIPLLLRHLQKWYSGARRSA